MRSDLPSEMTSWRGKAAAKVVEVVIPTYEVSAPNPHPMFLENRVYQGSSGRVYPLPRYDRVSENRVDKSYIGIVLENEYLYVMILPEIGGRVHILRDKTNDYDLIYRQDVIKPALVGLAGPWISGGIEFNWPQHHRPSTFMPCEYFIEDAPDGSVTVWLSEHEPIQRMKGMHGLCLRPGVASLETKVRLTNRTPIQQTFLWWANAGIEVHEEYQSVFPPDVEVIGDHAKRAIESYPAVKDRYYGVAYGERAKNGTPPSERPEKFAQAADLPPNRLDWYANIPVPTSYMVLKTDYGFLGGYDHRRQAGLIHYANKHLSPGKKQWTWGNHRFGYAWDRNLSDDERPYIELMAGVYTDNQPDFAFLAPYETKTFSQFWYPIKQIGPPKIANQLAAISVEEDGPFVHLGVCVTAALPNAVLRVQSGVGPASHRCDLVPGEAISVTLPRSEGALSVTLLQGDRVLLRFPEPALTTETPIEPALEPQAPSAMSSADERYVTGVHLEQYRHPTRSPEDYWLEALRADPHDSRCLVAMGVRTLRRGLLAEAEEFLRRAVRSLTRLNPNPPTSEAHYYLGLCLERQGRYPEAEAAYYKSSWNYGHKADAHYRLAVLACRAGDLAEAKRHLAECLIGLGDHSGATNLLSAIERRSGEPDAHLAQSVLARDPLDHWALREAWMVTGDSAYEERLRTALREDPQNHIDLALDYGECGMDEDGLAVLDQFSGRDSMVEVFRWDFRRRLGLPESDNRVVDIFFPNRLEEEQALRRFASAHPHNGVCQASLGNLLYDKARYPEAIAAWQEAVSISPLLAPVWRNLGFAYYNVFHDHESSLAAYHRAHELSPLDGTILYEYDQLKKRIGALPKSRLRFLDAKVETVLTRDDLAIEFCRLCNLGGKPETALTILSTRRFQPWEGGEGLALEQHVRTRLNLAGSALRAGKTALALEHLAEAEAVPRNLGEDFHLLANRSELWFWMGRAHEAAGHLDEAQAYWRRAVHSGGDFQGMRVESISEATFYKAASLAALGEEQDARRIFKQISAHGDGLLETEGKVDYFATSLPEMSLFKADLTSIQHARGLFLKVQAAFGLGRLAELKTCLEKLLALDPGYAPALFFAMDFGIDVAGPDRVEVRVRRDGKNSGKRPPTSED